MRKELVFLIFRVCSEKSWRRPAFGQFRRYWTCPTAHGSFWRFLPIILWEHIEIDTNFKIWGPRPLWSEMIHILDLTHFDHINPPNYIYNRKALDHGYLFTLSIHLAEIPSSPQNFANTYQSCKISNLLQGPILSNQILPREKGVNRDIFCTSTLKNRT